MRKKMLYSENRFNPHAHSYFYYSVPERGSAEFWHFCLSADGACQPALREQCHGGRAGSVGAIVAPGDKMEELRSHPKSGADWRTDCLSSALFSYPQDLIFFSRGVYFSGGVFPVVAGAKRDWLRLH